MKKIPLTQGKFAIVDDCDYKELSKFKWNAQRAKATWYAWRYVGNRKCIKMHRQIMNPPDGMDTDHRDWDGLNNKRENLRVCTKTQNSMNRGLMSNNKSGFKGVSWNKHARKWKCQIYLNGKSTFLGYFFCIVKAARAYDKIALQTYGEFAYLNLKETE